MQTIDIQTGAPYQVLVGNGLLARTASLLDGVCTYERVAIVTDDNVAPLYLDTVKASFPDTVEVSSYVVAHGESAKCADNLVALWSFFAAQKLTRSDLIIALGGGVVGDLTGFAASSYLRGVNYVQIPTTLLAQADSSVGGKTAIDIPEGKNLVGSFYQPVAVLCDLDTLSTLTDEIFSDGVAEIIKYACIYDASLFDRIYHIKENDELLDILTRCIRIKAEVVAEDEHDTGRRMILNFGHTIGHAVEKYHHFTDYTHGQGVAIGMVRITRLAEQTGLTAPGCADRIEALCKACGLPTECDVPNDALFDICCLDKKNLRGVINIILLHDIGSCYIQKQTHDEFTAFLNQ